jgi:hypothetical protein
MMEERKGRASIHVLGEDHLSMTLALHACHATDRWGRSYVTSRALVTALPILVGVSPVRLMPFLGELFSAVAFLKSCFC